jgi:hypothetical protein
MMGGGAFGAGAGRRGEMAGRLTRAAAVLGVWPRVVKNSTPPMKKQKNEKQIRLPPRGPILHHDPESEPPESQLPLSDPPLSHDPESEPPELHEPESEPPESQLLLLLLLLEPLSLHQPPEPDELLLPLLPPLLTTPPMLPQMSMTPMTNSVKPVLNHQR